MGRKSFTIATGIVVLSSLVFACFSAALVAMPADAQRPENSQSARVGRIVAQEHRARCHAMAAGARAPIRKHRAFRESPSAIPTITPLLSSSTGPSCGIPECRSSGFWRTKPTDLWPTSAGSHANGDHDPCCLGHTFAKPARPAVHRRSAHERSASNGAFCHMRHGCEFGSGPGAKSSPSYSRRGSFWAGGCGIRV